MENLTNLDDMPATDWMLEAERLVMTRVQVIDRLLDSLTRFCRGTNQDHPAVCDIHTAIQAIAFQIEEHHGANEKHRDRESVLAGFSVRQQLAKAMDWLADQMIAEASNTPPGQAVPLVHLDAKAIKTVLADIIAEQQHVLIRTDEEESPDDVAA